MSVLIALISRRDGLVATEGRRFSPAYFENGVRLRDAQPETDEFNKTFSVCQGKVVGGFVGLLEFSGKAVAEHIQDILASSCPQPTSLEQIVSVIRPELKRRVEQIDKGEVLPGCRLLDVVLVGGRDLRRSDFLIIALRFKPSTSGSGIICEREDVPYQGASPCWYLLRGDDAAQRGGECILKANKSPSTDREHLRGLARRAVEAGIASAGISRHGIEKSCGGRFFVELTYY